MDENVMASEPMSAAYFINSSHQSVRLYVYSTVVAWQLLEKTLLRQRTHAIVEEVLDESSMQFVSHHGKQATGSLFACLFV
jgi:hypothetical protein